MYLSQHAFYCFVHIFYFLTVTHFVLYFSWLSPGHSGPIAAEVVHCILRLIGAEVVGLNSFAIYILVIVCLCIQSHTINLSYNVLSYSISLSTLPYKISLNFILIIQRTSFFSSSLYHCLEFSSTFLKTKFCSYFICRNS